jgi:2-iminobutanoate/2-iminopropanoate deaminase
MVIGMKKIIATKAAPGAVGPYAQAVEAGGCVYVSGQLPIDPATGAFAAEDAAGQAKQSLCNVRAILSEAGCTMEDVVSATVYLKDMEDFAAVNEVYASFFTEGGYPARCAVEVARLPKDARVEIAVTAYKG